MATLFKELTQDDVDLIKDLYRQADNPQEDLTRKEAQGQLADRFGVTERSIRNWAKELQIGVMGHNVIDGTKILIYDVETPRLRANVWWSGKHVYR